MLLQLLQKLVENAGQYQEASGGRETPVLCVFSYLPTYSLGGFWSPTTCVRPCFVYIRQFYAHIAFLTCFKYRNFNVLNFARNFSSAKRHSIHSEKIETDTELMLSTLTAIGKQVYKPLKTNGIAIRKCMCNNYLQGSQLLNTLNAFRCQLLE